jgi:hypothetical protein
MTSENLSPNPHLAFAAWLANPRGNVSSKAGNPLEDRARILGVTTRLLGTFGMGDNSSDE